MTYRTLLELFEQSVAEFRAQNALGSKQADGSFRWTTFEELAKLVDQARGGLVERGVGHGDRVAVIADNQLEWAILAFATFGLGAVLVPMYEAQRPEEWEFILKDSGTTLVAGGSKPVVMALRSITPQVETVRHVVGFSLPDDDQASFAQLLAEGAAHPAATANVAAEDLAGIIYTSGTTGVPKGVCLTHSNFTGDMGYVDGEGFLHITGRIKEQYKLENGKYVVPSPLEEELKLSPYVTNLMLYGLNRAYNVALVVLDVAATQRFAKSAGLDKVDLTQAPEVRALVMSELEKHAAAFKSYERPKKVVLVTEDFTTENDMLTPKMSLKRRNVLAKYGAQLDALYEA